MDSWRCLITRDGKRIRNYQPVIIRYADDFVVFHRELKIIQQCQKLISEWLEKVGLKLKPEKTRICNTLEVMEIDGKKQKPGFDFLGFNIRSYPVGEHHSGQTGHDELIGFKTIIKPSKKSIQAHYDNLREVINKNRTSPQAKLIKDLNPKIRGWCNYFRTVCSKEAFSRMDYLLWNKLRAWTKSRTGKANYSKLSNYFSEGIYGQWTFQTDKGMYLIKHQETEIKRHKLVKPSASPYDGNWTYWSNRRGQYPETPKRVSKLIKKQQGKCTFCHKYFSPDDIVEIDHIIPKSLGGTDNYENLQLLHRHCHDIKTKTDGSLNSYKRGKKDEKLSP
ncbi:group II intron reverse transcriptase [Crocosphaera watsonii]|uniref:group II intron reverse transcriptase n=1 Tax=Crocosphaera watsonii TaxID=263511 RepID=UPI0009E33432